MTRGTLAGNLFVWLVYFVPTLAAWLVRRSVPDLRLGRVFLANLLVGWTIIGWIACLGYVLLKLKSGGAPAGGHPALATAAGAPGWEPGRATAPCGACSATGRATCWACQGQGGRWSQPRTATDVAQWETCASCSGGQVQCPSCGGSGSV